MKPTYEIRISRLNETPGPDCLDRPEMALAYWRGTITKMPWFHPDREHVVALALNTRHRPVGHWLACLGTLNECIAHCREIYRGAIALNAYALLLMHNHPSGIPSPSDADQRLTRRLVDAGKVLQIALLDHVIIGDQPADRPFFSFREAGLV